MSKEYESYREWAEQYGHPVLSQIEWLEQRIDELEKKHESLQDQLRDCMIRICFLEGRDGCG
jgi:thiaminase